jgi:pimeloyl-ACP methyl ester carboxylesterase
MFYDALTAFDVLSSSTGSGESSSGAGDSNSDALGSINKSSIYMAGESMGGRVAIVAGAMEPRVAGVVGISTGGYGRMENQDYMTRLYVRSIDPDNYVSMISPRKLLLLHSKGDSIVQVGIAERTFSYASEPKLLLEDDGQDHGYYRHEKVMTLNEGLEWLVGYVPPVVPV